MTMAQVEEVARDCPDAPEAVRVCASCHDPDAQPSAVVHPSGNPWLSKLVCASCGALWAIERVTRGVARLAALGTKESAR